jgi:hypothetical protein
MAALLLVAAASLAAAAASGHSFGTPGRIGPGFFPLVVAIALGIASLVLLVRGRGPVPGGGIPPRTFGRAAVPVLGGLLAFALLLPVLGLGPATFALVMTASPFERARLMSTAGLAFVVAVLGALVFVLALGVRIPVIAW